METKKNPRKNVYRLTTLWFNAGLVVALAFVVMAFEWRSYYIEQRIDITKDNFGEVYDIPITQIDPPKPPPQPILPNPVVAEPEPDVEEIEYSFDMPDLADIEVPEPPKINDDDTPDTFFIWAEKMPEPEGGLAEFYKFVSENIKYPSLARKLGIEGQVAVQFIVDEEGNITDVQIARGIGAGCDEEVLRIMEKAPKWNPGKQRGKPVKVRMLVPINFKLNR